MIFGCSPKTGFRIGLAVVIVCIIATIVALSFVADGNLASAIIISAIMVGVIGIAYVIVNFSDRHSEKEPWSLL